MKRTLVLILALFMVLSFSPWASAGTTYKDDNITIDDSAIYPTTDGAISCGQTGNEFSGLYADAVEITTSLGTPVTFLTATPATLSSTVKGTTYICKTATHVTVTLPATVESGAMFSFVSGAGPTGDAGTVVHICPDILGDTDATIVYTNSTSGLEIYSDASAASITLVGDPDTTGNASDAWRVVQISGTWTVGN